MCYVCFSENCHLRYHKIYLTLCCCFSAELVLPLVFPFYTNVQFKIKYLLCMISHSNLSLLIYLSLRLTSIFLIEYFQYLPYLIVSAVVISIIMQDYYEKYLDRDSRKYIISMPYSLCIILDHMSRKYLHPVIHIIGTLPQSNRE